MSQLKSLSELKAGTLDLDKLVAELKSKPSASKEAGVALVHSAAEFGLSVKEYLILAAGKDPKDSAGLNGYERALFALNLPVRNDYENGIHLQAASETFSTYPGTRALFPQVIDDVLRFANRQDQFERVQPMLASSRVINGAEMLSTVVDDDSADRGTYTIPEGSRFPVRMVKTSEKAVRIYKHGSAIRFTYEFGRRASLDLLVPYANRVARELELSKVKSATAVLINGDGAYGAAPVVTQSSFNTDAGLTATNGQISWGNLLAWFVSRAKVGAPMDTVVMNWDGYFQWLMLFGRQNVLANATTSHPIDNATAAGAQLGRINLPMAMTPVISSDCPAGKLIGFSKADTLEELVEAASQIQESERSITNQTITLVRSENTGYRIVYGDTRSIYNFAA